jgi:hypothetical protein
MPWPAEENSQPHHFAVNWPNKTYYPEVPMRKIGIFLFSLALVLLLSGSGLAQRYIPDPDIYGKIAGAYQPVTLVAQIGYFRDRGGYYIRGNPRYGFRSKVILNQNYQVLRRLARSGRFVTISGRVSPLEFRANHVYIESINGRSYRGRHAPLVRIY